MTTDQLIEIMLAAYHSVNAADVTITEWRKARQAFWAALAPETQEWLFRHGRTPPAHIEPITKTLTSISPQEAGAVIPQLTEADQLLTFASAVLDYIHPPADWSLDELRAGWGGPTGTGLISPATITGDGRFHTVV